MKKLLSLAAVLVIVASCKKDNAPADKAVLSITPEILVSYAGQTWKNISPDIENKKDYMYDPENASNSSAIISLPAMDPNTPGRQYKLRLNVNQQRIVSSVILECPDTLDVNTGNQLFLYYHDHAFANLPDVTYQQATATENQQPVITLDALLQQLLAHNCAEPMLTFRNATLELAASYHQFHEQRGLFNFNITAY